MNTTRKEAQIEQADALLKDIGHKFRKPEKPKSKPFKNVGTYENRSIVQTN